MMSRDSFTMTDALAPFGSVVLSVPHAGRDYDPALLAKLRVPEASIRGLEDRYADRLAETAIAAGVPTIVAHAPRLVIDLNRGPDDLDHDYVADSPRTGAPTSARARSGLGLIPTRLWGVGSLWRGPFNAFDVAARLRQVHSPYHEAIDAALAAARLRWGTALLVDLHSMPPIGGAESPDIVIGDRFGASAGSILTAIAESHFKGLGFRVAINAPYAGGYIVTRHARPLANIHALQIEVSRSLYLDAALDEVGPGLTRMQGVILGLVRSLTDELTARISQAAE